MAKAWNNFADPVDAVTIASYKALGMTVVVSGNGLVMAIGSPPPVGKLAKLGGSVGTYLLVNGEWVLDRTLSNRKPRKADRFGIAIAINFDASRLLIGAPNAKSNGRKNQGGVVLYNYRIRKGKGKWRTLANFSPPVIKTPQLFGISVGFTANAGTIVIGSPLTPAPDGVSVGNVSVYNTGPKGNWTPIRIYPPVNSGVVNFGNVVTIDPITAAIAITSSVIDPNNPNITIPATVSYGTGAGGGFTPAPVTPVISIFKIPPKTTFNTKITVAPDGLTLVVNTNTYTDMYPARGKELYFSNINGTWIEDT